VFSPVIQYSLAGGISLRKQAPERLQSMGLFDFSHCGTSVFSKFSSSFNRENDEKEPIDTVLKPQYAMDLI
jgi:hypothetical protein